MHGNRALGNRKGASLQLNRLGQLYQQQNKIERAIKCYKEAEAMLQDMDDKHGLGAILNNLGMIYHQQGNLEQALEYLQQAEKSNRIINDKRELFNSFSCLVEVYQEKSEDKQAWDFYLQAMNLVKTFACKQQQLSLLERILLLAEKFADHESKTRLTTEIDECNKIAKSFTSSLEYHEREEAYCQALDDRRGQANHLAQIATLYKEQQQFNVAIEYYQKSFIICQQEVKNFIRYTSDETNEYKREAALQIGNIVGIYREQKQFDQAVEYYQQTLKMNFYNDIMVKSNIGMVYYEQGNIKQARQEFHGVDLNLLSTNGDKQKLAHIQKIVKLLDRIESGEQGQGEIDQQIRQHLKGFFS